MTRLKLRVIFFDVGGEMWRHMICAADVYSGLHYKQGGAMGAAAYALCLVGSRRDPLYWPV